MTLYLRFPVELTSPVERVTGNLPAKVRGIVWGETEKITRQEQLTASGVIQADQVAVASEFGGRIAEIRVREGETVAEGDLLVQLDTTLLDAQIAAAEALVASAEAAVAQAEAAVRPGQIEVARAQLAQAEAARVAARQAVTDTMVLVENPQDVQLQIAVSAAQVEAAEHRLAQAEAIRDAAGIAKDKFESLRGEGGRRSFLVASGSLDDLPGELPPDLVEAVEGVGGSYSHGNWELQVSGGAFQLFTHRSVNLPLDFHLTPNQWWQAWVGVNAAAAQLEGAQSGLYHLALQRESSQILEVQLDEALSTLAQAGAQVALAQAQLDGLQAGLADEQIAALDARRSQAQAAVESLETLRSLMALRSPIDGTVVSVYSYEGEVAAAGATLITVADLTGLSLQVYVPENRIGQITLEGEVPVMVDSLPGKQLTGTVVRIADQAEFTPRNVATQEERVNLVFSVEIHLDNVEGLLKPGMPAEVRFEVEE
jgi:multidrug efflux pump subunit AcrA (membrane-fusion protein)